MNSWLVPDMSYMALGTVDSSRPDEIMIEGLSGRRLPLFGLEGCLEGFLYVTVLVTEDILRKGSPVKVESVLGVAPNTRHYPRYLNIDSSAGGWCFLKMEYCSEHPSAPMYYSSCNFPTREDQPRDHYVFAVSDWQYRLVDTPPTGTKYIVTDYSPDVIRKLPCLCAGPDVSYTSEPCWKGEISGEEGDLIILTDGKYDRWIVTKNAVEV